MSETRCPECGFTVGGQNHEVTCSLNPRRSAPVLPDLGDGERLGALSPEQLYAAHRAFLHVTKNWDPTSWTVQPEYVTRMFERVFAAATEGLRSQLASRDARISTLTSDLLTSDTHLKNLREVRESLDAQISTLEAELAKIQRAVGNVCLAFHDWPEYTGSEYCQAERKNAINDLAEAAASTAPA